MQAIFSKIKVVTNTDGTNPIDVREWYFAPIVHIENGIPYFTIPQQSRLFKLDDLEMAEYYGEFETYIQDNEMTFFVDILLSMNFYQQELIHINTPFPMKMTRSA